MATASEAGKSRGEALAAASEDDDSTFSFPANFAEIVASLPQGPPCPAVPSPRLYRGFWLAEVIVQSLPEVHARFKPRDTDVLLASFPKCGTTWLKALCFATARRSAHSPFDSGHPLLRRSPHDCVKFIDTLRFFQDDDDDDDSDQAPRLLATHLPYSLLPERATARCRIVYIARDPKDALVSLWHFNAGVETTTTADMASAAAAKFEEAFELCCQGRYGVGPQWEHTREYWEASKRRPERVLCLKYEEMLQDPENSLKRMAEFMGCRFSAAEEDAGVVDAIVQLCSFDKQRSMAVSKSGAYGLKGLLSIDNRHFFRKGVAGDWRNYMTPEMAARLDGIVEEALKGSGFTFGIPT